MNEKYEKTIEFEKNGKKIKKKVNTLTDISNDFNEKFRQYYFGGRSEVFNFNKMDVIYVDFNSLYPSVMVNNVFPIPPFKKIDVGTYFKLNDKVFALKCIVDESKEQYPLVASKINNKLVFAACEKETILTIEEYNYIKENRPNTTISVLEFYVCKDWDTIFNYMKAYYDKRVEFKKQEIVSCFEYFIKIFLNSSYGKFGEHKEKKCMKFFALSELTKDELIEIQKENPSSEIDYALGYIHIHEKDEKHVKSNLIYASRITALARLELMKVIDYCDKNNMRFCYCDTDSLFIENSQDNMKKLEPLIDEYELGKLKIEGIFQDFQAFGSKEYIYKKGGKIQTKCKGLPQNSDYINYIENGIRVVRPIKYKESLVRRVDIENSIEVIKKKNTYYDKRIMNSDLTTSPIGNELHENKELILKMLNIEIKPQFKEYKRKVMVGKFGNRICCPICKQTIYLSEFIEKSEKFNEMNDIVPLVNEKVCTHLSRFTEKVDSNKNYAIFEKMV